MILIKRLQSRKLIRLIRDIGNKKIILRILTFDTHLNNFFVGCSIGKSVSPHKNGWNIFIFQNNRLYDRLRNGYTNNKPFPIFCFIPDKRNLHLWSRSQMLVHLIIKIITLIICTFSVKTDQFICFIFYPNIKITTGCIGKSCNTFQPAHNILPVKDTLAFQFIIL